VGTTLLRHVHPLLEHAVTNDLELLMGFSHQ
jgi:hypothetical protein